MRGNNTGDLMMFEGVEPPVKKYFLKRRYPTLGCKHQQNGFIKLRLYYLKSTHLLTYFLKGEVNFLSLKMIALDLR
jgi:hypothetical protein